MSTSVAEVTNDADISNTVRVTLTPYPLEILSMLKPNEVYDPSWSPDGTQVIYVEHFRATYSIKVLSVGATSVMDTLYTSINRLAEPTISSDGYFVLFGEQVAPESLDLQYGTWRLRYMSSDGTGVVTILDDGAANLHPSWVTPTQVTFQWWAYGAMPSTAFQMALIDLAGQGRVEMGEGEYPRLVMI